MRNTIVGFNQEKLVEYGLDVKDAMLLRYIVDFRNTGRMTSVVVDNKVYYWVSYKHIKEDLPILKINNNDAIRKRFKKLEEAKVLEHYHRKDGGSFSYYNVGEAYYELIATDKEQEDSCQESADLQLESSTLTDEKQEQNNKSTKDNNTNIYNTDDVDELLELYPKKKGKVQAIKKIAKILKRTSKEELRRAIDRYCREVKDKDKQFILNASTFFNDRYEDYLDSNYGDDIRENTDITKFLDDIDDEIIVFEEEL